MAETAAAGHYRVIARRWRPKRLSDLVGQDVLVRTLTNALASGNLAHAFLFSGIRGVGKTTTARILARALNCTGPDGEGGPTATPCGRCASCVAMDDDKAIDVIEMDAATRTGINDIREIVDSVRYAPASARFKIFIIDEVHMLSLQAFNGLLKTLEEPPPYVKFIFATTEVRKLPVTILSRCQRFDLKRVERHVLSDYYGKIAKSENVSIDEEAVDLIAGAAHGSVRDGLSLLDQARVLSDGHITGPNVRSMLGLADQMFPLRILTMVADGDVAALLKNYRSVSTDGLDPATFLQDLMAMCHALSCMHVSEQALPEGFDWLVKTPEAGALKQRLGLGHLARIWQMLLKGVDDIKMAGVPDQAAEMVLLRLAYATDMPPPGELLRLLQESDETQGEAVSPSGQKAPSSPTPVSQLFNDRGSIEAQKEVPEASDQKETERTPSKDGQSKLSSLQDAVALLYRVQDGILAAQIERHARPIAFEPGRIEIGLADGPSDLAGRFASRLSAITGNRWVVVIGHDDTTPTLLEERDHYQRMRLEELVARDEFRQLMEQFPGARMVEVRKSGLDKNKDSGQSDPGQDAPSMSSHIGQKENRR